MKEEICNGTVLTGDADVMELLKQAEIELPPPEEIKKHPRATAVIRFDHGEQEWLVMAHYVPGDEGLVAWGLPVTIPEERRTEYFARLLALVALRDAMQFLPKMAAAMSGNPTNN